MKKRNRLNQLKNMSMKRKRQIVYMVLAVAILFGAVPFIIHQLTVWNEKVTIDYDTVTIGKDDLWNMTNINGFSESGKVLLYEYAPLGGTEWSVQDSNILWAEDLNASQNALVINSEQSGTPDSSAYSEIYMMLDLHISNLTNYDKVRFSVNTPKLAKMKIYYGLDYENFHSTSDFSFSAYRKLAKEWEAQTGNRTHWWNYSTLDVMVDRVEYDQWGDGDDNPMIMVNIRTVNGVVFETGDIVKWNIDLIENSIPQIKEKTALQIGALIIGIVLIGIGWVSTPWWNPTDPNNPGWFDNLLSKIFVRLSNFRGKRKKGGRK